MRLLHDLLGSAGSRSVAEPAPWPSFVADDHTPVEFSLSFLRSERPELRFLVERLAPDVNAGRATRWFTEQLAHRYGLALDRFDAVAGLFLPAQPRGRFSLWHAVVLRADGRHHFKVYFDPTARGEDRAPALVAAALERLGLGAAGRTVVAPAFGPGPRPDRFMFFSLDLHAGPLSRTKVYVAHHGAGPADVERTTRAVPAAVPGAAAEFCRLVGGGQGRFDARPLLSCYSFLGDDGDSPSGYTLYLPIRDYAPDDKVARDRVATLLERNGADPMVLDRALNSVAHRPLAAGVGLISYVSLRMGLRPAVTVYLSSEAYRTSAEPAGARP
ncbi:MAG TPA: tryptophan dimethylallyltransferase family protein [Pseudonocardiaceae bacterium]